MHGAHRRNAIHTGLARHAGVRVADFFFFAYQGAKSARCSRSISTRVLLSSGNRSILSSQIDSTRKSGVPKKLVMKLVEQPFSRQRYDALHIGMISERVPAPDAIVANNEAVK